MEKKQSSMKHDLAEQVEEECEAYDVNAAVETQAEKLGCYVSYPEDNELQIDIDSEEAYVNFCKRIKEVSRMFLEEKINIQVWPSKSGMPRRHISVWFEETTWFQPWQRIALQFTLGSDPIRETLNALRQCARTNEESTSRFFEPIGAKRNIIENYWLLEGKTIPQPPPKNKFTGELPGNIDDEIPF